MVTDSKSKKNSFTKRFFIYCFISLIICLVGYFFLLDINDEVKIGNTWPIFVLMIVYAIVIFLGVVIWDYKKKVNIENLRVFIERAERYEDWDTSSMTFYKDEIGEISEKIIDLYKKLKETQIALSDEYKKNLYQEFEQIRIKRQLTQNINHELKTPVSSIQGYLETIINNPNISQEKKDEFIVKCYNQTIRLTQLLQDISLITRMDEASQMIGKETIFLCEYVRELFAEHEKKIMEKGFIIDNLIPDNISINASPSLINSLFSNLIENAISYSGGSKITVKLIKESPSHYYFSFYDNGVGIEEKHLHRIFERFYRIDKGRSRKLGGTGLGLAIVKNAVGLHGGKIVAMSKDGGGLEFMFSLKKNL